jgi:hypothetical protein
MKQSVRWSALLVSTLIFLSLAVGAHATTLSVALDVTGTGLSVADGGVGLQTLGTGTATITVDIDGPVQAALLYWAGRDRPCPQSPPGTCVIPSQPYKDQVLRFEGNLITGTIIGTEAQPVSGGGPINNIAFLADVTSIVLAKGIGLQSFSVQDGDGGQNLFSLEGAGLLVVYMDPGDAAQYRVIVFDGLDLAYGDDPTPGATRVTSPVVFSHGGMSSARKATLRLFVGGATASRPDRVDVSNNPGIVDGLDGTDGAAFDTDASVIDVPAGIASTTVQLFSAPEGQDPDTLLWEVAVLRVPLEDAPPPDMGCGPGYWKNHTEAWPPTGYSPGQAVSSVFSGAPSPLASQSLLQALQGSGGKGTAGAARRLVRAGVAAVLNGAHPDVNYPRTTGSILTDVHAVLTGGDRTTMLELAAELDADNNLPCPLF